MTVEQATVYLKEEKKECQLQRTIKRKSKNKAIRNKESSDKFAVIFCLFYVKRMNSGFAIVLV